MSLWYFLELSTVLMFIPVVQKQVILIKRIVIICSPMSPPSTLSTGAEERLLQSRFVKISFSKQIFYPTRFVNINGTTAILEMTCRYFYFCKHKIVNLCTTAFIQYLQQFSAVVIPQRTHI